MGVPAGCRPATSDDSPAIRELVFGVLTEYGLQPDPQGTDADLTDVGASYARGGFWVVEREGRIVATVGLMPHPPRTCELRKMYLAPAARGQGLGKGLLAYALDQARELGFRRVELETHSVLVEAISMYRKAGFTPVPLGHEAAPRCDQAWALDL